MAEDELGRRVPPVQHHGGRSSIVWFNGDRSEFAQAASAGSADAVAFDEKGVTIGTGVALGITMSLPCSPLRCVERPC